jgi:DNA-binding YbaB/EbfC family protein
MNIQKMMQQAQAMQSKVQAELDALRVAASSGGDLVKVEMSGHKELLSVKIDPSVVDSSSDGAREESAQTIEDLVLAACREASRRVDEEVQRKTQSMLGGLMR